MAIKSTKSTKSAKSTKSTKSAKSTKARKERPVYDYEFEVTRVFEGRYGTIFDVKINNVTVNGCRVCSTTEGEPFVGMPQRKGKDGRWYSYVYAPLTDEQNAELLGLVADYIDEHSEDEEDEDE